MHQSSGARTAHGSFKWRLLAHASAGALLVCMAGPLKAHAEANPSHVTLELSGDWDRYGKGDTQFFTPSTGLTDTFIRPKDGFGIEGRLVYQPADNPWQFGLGVRYGRTKSVSKSGHFATSSSYQTVIGTYPTGEDGTGYITGNVNTTHTKDLQATHKEHHIVADFDIGREVGLGDGIHSVLTAGVRFANFESTTSGTYSTATSYSITSTKYAPQTGSSSTHVIGHLKRKLNAVGPRVAWHASAPLGGSQFSVDWDVGAAVLFGKQHATADAVVDGVPMQVFSRSKSVNVPNLDGRLALAWHAPSNGFTIKAGVRGEGFFRVMDGGYTTNHSTKRIDYGPFVSLGVQF